MRILIVMLAALFSFTGTGVAAVLTPQRPNSDIRQVRPQTRSQTRQRNNLVRTPPVRDLVQGYYVDRFQQELNLTGEQSDRVLPALRRSLQRRNELAQQRAQTLNRLRLALAEGAPEEEIAARTRELDEADTALRDVQREFLLTADRELTPEQRANLRIVLPNLENRIRNLIERSRSADRAPPR